jgi:ribose 5-phosphate isomerase A
MKEFEDTKRLVGFRAVDGFVSSGMRLGLGTGSTAIWVVRRVAERVREGALSDLRIVTTSLQSEIEARSLGLPVVTLNDAGMEEGLDLTIDGADEIDRDRNLIKGGGGALLAEKVVAYASKRFIVIADESKLSPALCRRSPVPVEIVPFALSPVVRVLTAMGAKVALREGTRKAGPVVTDHGNLILDALFKGDFDPRVMEEKIKLIPGVLEDGFFTKKRPELLIGRGDGTVEHMA